MILAKISVISEVLGMPPIAQQLPADHRHENPRTRALPGNALTGGSDSSVSVSRQLGPFSDQYQLDVQVLMLRFSGLNIALHQCFAGGITTRCFSEGPN